MVVLPSYLHFQHLLLFSLRQIKEQNPVETKGLSETHEQEEGGRKQVNNKNKIKKITGQAKETRGVAALLYFTPGIRRAKESCDSTIVF